MINSPTENVKLTFEQLQQIDVVQKQLANLQSEINIASKSLNVLKKDCDKVTKERIYQEELLSNLTVDVKKVEDRLGELTKERDTAIAQLDKAREETTKLNSSNCKKDLELKDRENKLQKEEEDLEKKVADFNIKSNQLLKEQDDLKNKKSILSKAIEQI